MVRRRGRNVFVFEKLVVMRTRKRSGPQHEVGENAREREQSKSAGHGGQVGITQAKQQRAKRQKDSQAPPNTHAEGGADQQNPADQDQNNSEGEKDESHHASVLSRRSAIT